MLSRAPAVPPVLPVLRVCVLQVEEVAQEFQNLRFDKTIPPRLSCEFWGKKFKIPPDRVDKAYLSIGRSHPSESRGSTCTLKIQLNEM